MNHVLGALVSHVDRELPAAAGQGDVFVIVDLRDLVELRIGDDRTVVVDLNDVALVETADVIAVRFLVAVLELDFLCEHGQVVRFAHQLDIVLHVNRLGHDSVARLNVQVVLALVLLNLKAAHALGGDLGIVELVAVHQFLSDLGVLAVNRQADRELVLFARLENIVAEHNAVLVSADLHIGRVLEGNGLVFGRRIARGAVVLRVARGAARITGIEKQVGIAGNNGGTVADFVICKSCHANGHGRGGGKHNCKHFFHNWGSS